MGQDKAMLPVGKGTLLDLMQRKLAATELFDQIVVCRDQQLGGTTSKCLADIHPGKGPLGALYTLSIHYPDHSVLVVPVDMPLLGPELLRELCASYGKETTALYYEGHHFPLLLHLNKKTILHLAKRIKNNHADLSVGGLIRDIEARQLPAPKNISQLANLNTPQEWQALRQQLDHPNGLNQGRLSSSISADHSYKP